MPYDDPDPTDPMTLTGVELVVDDAGAVREMAVCFAEEYVRLGLSEAAIVELFAGGEFAGPKLAVSQLGLEAVREIVREQFVLRGPRAGRVSVDRLPGGAIGLPVMEP